MIDEDGISIEEIEEMAEVIRRQNDILEHLTDIIDARDEMRRAELINIIGHISRQWQSPFRRDELEEFDVDELEDLLTFVRRVGSGTRQSLQRTFQQDLDRNKRITRLKIRFTKQVADLPYLEMKYKKPILSKLSEYFIHFDDLQVIREESKAIISKGLKEAHQLMLNNDEPIPQELEDHFKLTLESGDELLL